MSHSSVLTPSAARASDFLGLVRRYADRPAVHSLLGTATFSQIGRSAAALALRLCEAGVRPGDFVAIFLRNGAAAVWASFGVVLTGACEVQINAGLSDAERRHCLSLAPARIVVTTSAEAAAFRQMGREVVIVEDIGVADPSALALPRIDSETFGRVNFTSGTTGFPKAIVSTHQRRWLGNLVLRASLPNLPGPKSSILLVTPFSHGAGLFTQAYLSCGASVTLLDGMDMAFIEGLLARGSVDALFGSPTVLAKLSQAFAGRKFDGLTSIFCGTATLAPGVYAAIKSIFGPVVFLTYGKTEAHSPLAQLPADETDRFYSSGEADSGHSCLGWPAPGVEIDIADSAGAPCPAGQSGEIRVRASHMTNGWIDSEGFHDWGLEGRHATGDLGYFDAAGRLRLVGRAGDVIKTGGYKIFPAEIELALAAVGAEAVALGAPSPYWGEIVVAVSEKPCDGTQLEAALGDRLAAYKRPRAFLVVDSFPRNAQGKVVRRDLLRLIDERYTLVDGPYPRFETRR